MRSLSRKSSLGWVKGRLQVHVLRNIGREPGFAGDAPRGAPDGPAIITVTRHWIGGYGHCSVKWEQTEKFAPILFHVLAGLMAWATIPMSKPPMQKPMAHWTRTSEIPIKLAGTMTPTIQAKMERFTLYLLILG